MSHGFTRIDTDTAHVLISVRFPRRERDCIGPPARKERAPQDDKAGG